MRRAAGRARTVFFEVMSWRYTPMCTSPANPSWPLRSSRVRGSAGWGGGKVPALLHQARTVCRRAERETVRLSRKEPVDAAILKFLNRLSDALFVLARWVSKTQGEPELLWERDSTTV